MSEHAIEATRLVREFKKGPRAVDGIDLAVSPGEIYGFLGPNGAGKSTTVHMLTTLLPPTSGTARVPGHEVSRLAREEGATVFLTTQYLEEADVLADRVGIIDHGRIVAEGTPAALKAEVGRPTVEAIPTASAERGRAAEILAGFGDPAPSVKGVAVLLRPRADLADIVRPLDAVELDPDEL